MNQAVQSVRRPGRSREIPAGVWFNAAFLLAVLGLWVAGFYYASINTFSLIWCSILLEALPFMLLGSVIGGLIETLVSSERMAEWLPKRRWQTIVLAAGLGLIFPVCECAVVPVVRRLARKGFPLGAVVAYLLGGPIVNPVVGASTVLAYAGDWKIMALRLGLGYLAAVAVGFGMTRLFDAKQAFVRDVSYPRPAPACQCGHHHAPQRRAGVRERASKPVCGCGHAHAAAGEAGWRGKLNRIFLHASDDFLSAGRYLIIGAFVAALANAFIGREAFARLTNLPGAAVIVMMILAVALNLCSEADAFVAASFRTLMPMSAQLAFMLLGPMLDLKLLLMYRTLFKPRAILALATLIVLAVLTASWALQWGGM